jgi:hypothetical protein
MLDIFLHMDVKSDNFISHSEMEPLFKLLREDKTLTEVKEPKSTADPEDPPAEDPVEKFITEIEGEESIDRKHFLDIMDGYKKFKL